VFAPIFVKAYQYLRQSKTNMLVDTFYTYHGNGIHSTEAFNETGCKVARLHNTCIYSVASRSWCQITPFTQSCIMSSRILAPKYRCGHPSGHPKLLQVETSRVWLPNNWGCR